MEASFHLYLICILPLSSLSVFHAGPPPSLSSSPTFVCGENLTSPFPPLSSPLLPLLHLPINLLLILDFFHFSFLPAPLLEDGGKDDIFVV